MFVPPPSEENLLIVQQSCLPKGVAVRGLFLAAAGVSSLGLLLFFILTASPGKQSDNLIISEVSLSPTVIGSRVPLYDVEVVPYVFRELDRKQKAMDRANDRVLMQRAPSSVRKPETRAPDQKSKEVEPEPSYGPWLNGRVLVSASGLRLFSKGVAIFVKDNKKVVFQAGKVLPNGEVVISVNDRSLEIKTNVRDIQLVDDGA